MDQKRKFPFMFILVLSVPIFAGMYSAHFLSAELQRISLSSFCCGVFGATLAEAYISKRLVGLPLYCVITVAFVLSAIGGWLLLLEFRDSPMNSTAFYLCIALLLAALATNSFLNSGRPSQRGKEMHWMRAGRTFGVTSVFVLAICALNKLSFVSFTPVIFACYLLLDPLLFRRRTNS